MIYDAESTGKIALYAARAATKELMNNYFLMRKYFHIERDDILSEALVGAAEAVRAYDSSRETGLYAYARVSAYRAGRKAMSKQLTGLTAGITKRSPMIVNEPIEILDQEDMEVPPPKGKLSGEEELIKEGECLWGVRINNAALVEAIMLLKENEQYVVIQHTVLEKPFSAIGKYLGVSRQRVEQVFSAAMKKIRAATTLPDMKEG